MPLTPNDWNVVVVGHWNRAILSPAGIAKRLFGLDEGTPVSVLVPLDVVAPYHIQHANLTVIPGHDRLIVAPVNNTFENLVQAVRVIQKALEELPRTPVFATGLNLTYKSEAGVDEVQQAVTTPWDDQLSNKKFVIATRAVMRSVKWRDGTVNVSVTQEVTSSLVGFNFDFKSQSADAIRAWLELTADDIKQQVDALFDTIGLSPEDIDNV